MKVRKGEVVVSLYSEIKGYKHSDGGTQLIVFIPGKEVGHQIKRYRVGSKANAEIRLDDGRTISADQRAKAYATMKDISLYTGHMPEEIKALMKYDYIAKTGADYFSLSDCSVTTGRLFINHLIEFCFQNHIGLSEEGLKRTDDIDHYLFLAIKYRSCILCGKKADLHHTKGSTVGMGGNRAKMSHTGREFIALCREHHNQVHQEGEKELFDKYHVYGIVLDNETLKDLGYKAHEIKEDANEPTA